MADYNTYFLKQLLKGTATYIPGLRKVFAKGTGGTDSARYCYSVWMRHLVMARKNGLINRLESVAELGPGDSIGIGLAALISGVKRYSAFDIVRYADNNKNLEIFNDLIELFSSAEDIPDDNEFPNLKPVIDSYLFPNHILRKEYISETLNKKRVESIKNIINTAKSRSDDNVEISYYAPWYDAAFVKEESIDMVFSQAVLEHIDDLESVYRTLYRWLKPGGFMSHVIDFKSHGFAKAWNGHWAYSDTSWKLIRGARPYLLNRQPVSTHLELMKKNNFEIVCEIKYSNLSGIKRDELSLRMKGMSDNDMSTSEAYILAVKR